MIKIRKKIHLCFKLIHKVIRKTVVILPVLLCSELCRRFTVCDCHYLLAVWWPGLW